eukprot:820783-Amphidinium_carterae.1
MSCSEATLPREVGHLSLSALSTALRRQQADLSTVDRAPTNLCCATRYSAASASLSIRRRSNGALLHEGRCSPR